MTMLLVLLLTFVTSALAGSECPPRENIYPCSCLSVPQGKKLFFTSVTCHRLPSTDAFTSIFGALRQMNIDHFYLYDSFWEAHMLGAEGENKKVLPADWLTLLKIKEIEIVDTTLSSSFACNAKISCRNDVTTRFTAVNSSSHEKISSLCKYSGSKMYSWTGCMSKLQQFHFKHGQLTGVRGDMFPHRMSRLTELDLSYNNIMEIESEAFKNLPKLSILRLSHNVLENLNNLAGAKLSELQELDVSWNLLKTLSSNFFTTFPKIKSFIAHNNNMMHLEESEWKGVPDTLRNIDLKDNPIHCDCNIRWINTTFHINVIIEGHCDSPEDYENSLIRRASRLLNERCTPEGEIGTRESKKTTKAAAVRKSIFPTQLGKSRVPVRFTMNTEIV